MRDMRLFYRILLIYPVYKYSKNIRWSISVKLSVHSGRISAAVLPTRCGLEYEKNLSYFTTFLHNCLCCLLYEKVLRYSLDFSATAFATLFCVSSASCGLRRLSTAFATSTVIF